MIEEITRPCPFCSNPVLHTVNFGDDVWGLRCAICGMHGPLALSEEDAILKWNNNRN